MNAVRHGLLAKCVVLEKESRAGFDSMLEDFISRFQPADGVELALVEEMLSAFWRQRRAWAIETRLMDTAMSNESAGDGLTRLANAFVAASAQPSLQLIQRYETRLHRTFQRALSNLVVMRSLDKQRDLPPDEPPVSESKPEEAREDPVPVQASPGTDCDAPPETFDDQSSHHPNPVHSDLDSADLDAAAAPSAPAAAAATEERSADLKGIAASKPAHGNCQTNPTGPVPPTSGPAQFGVLHILPNEPSSISGHFAAGRPEPQLNR